jgi:hypothetical protein
MPVVPDTPADTHDDDGSDGCLCGLEHIESESTSDIELPQASGGVETETDEEPEHGDEVDGCDLDFALGDATSDEELPSGFLDTLGQPREFRFW